MTFHYSKAKQAMLDSREKGGRKEYVRNVRKCKQYEKERSSMIDGNRKK